APTIACPRQSPGSPLANPELIGEREQTRQVLTGQPARLPSATVSFQPPPTSYASDNSRRRTGWRLPARPCLPNRSRDITAAPMTSLSRRAGRHPVARADRFILSAAVAPGWVLGGGT